MTTISTLSSHQETAAILKNLATQLNKAAELYLENKADQGQRATQTAFDNFQHFQSGAWAC